MRITTIGFGYTKNLGNYENCKLYLEAKLEDWEEVSESIDSLRDRVVAELELPDKYRDLRGKCDRKLAELEALKSEIEVKKTELVRAQEAWDGFAEFLVGHGIDPVTLTIENFAATRADHSPIPDRSYRQQHSPYPFEVANDEDEEENDENDGEEYAYYPVDQIDEDLPRAALEF